MKQPKLIRLALTTAILTALTPLVFAADTALDPQAQSQPQQAPAPDAVGGKGNAAAKSDTQSLEGIVVTGTAAAGGVRKLDASYNITAANAEQIKQANPVSTADLLKIAPGIWPESSGGQTGANIEIAGFPGGGDAPFFTNMVNGSPLYGMSSLSFMDSSSLLRLDDTVERVEIVTGGPGAVFGAGQMGATANFILKQGTSEPSGSVGLTYGNEGLWRFDGFYGFKLAEGWYASVGGFWRTSDGVRSSEFPSDQGGQLTATLTHDLDNGSIMLWARKLDDKNQFIVPQPLIEDNNNKFSLYPGFNALTDSYASKAIQHVTLPNPAGGTESADLANGRGGNLNFFGGNYDAEFGGWSVSDKFLYDTGDLNTNALFSGPNPKPLSYFIYGCNVSQSAGYCDSHNQPIDTNILNGGSGYAASTNVNASVGLGQSVITQGWWFIQKHLTNLNNDFRLSKELFDGNTLTAGLYLAHYTDKDNWSLGNNMLMTNTPNAKPVTLSYVQGGQTIYITNPQGIYNYNGNYNIVENGTGNNKAFYLSDSWKLDRWLFDVSGRVENTDVSQHTCNRKSVNLDGNLNTLFDNTTPICDGTFDNENYSKTHPSWTFGANYEIADNMSVYARASTGGHFDDFDNGIRGAGGNFAPMQKVRSLEGGYKYGSETIFLDVNVYHKQFTGLPYSPTDPNGNPVLDANGNPITSAFGSDSKGLNLNGTWSPIENLKLTLIGDYMDGHYSHADTVQQYTDINGRTQFISIDGAPLQRQPKIRFLFTPSYRVPTDWGDITGWVTYSHVGQRYEDTTGLQPLGAYSTWDFGILANVNKNWEFRVQGTNLSNEIGLTEGNARVGGVATGVGGVLLARSIQGREVNFQVKYKF
jgi:outer membrane receptor protein involved in Fe transport